MINIMPFTAKREKEPFIDIRQLLFSQRGRADDLVNLSSPIPSSLFI
jgi:hypothetical protein